MKKLLAILASLLLLATGAGDVWANENVSASASLRKEKMYEEEMLKLEIERIYDIRVIKLEKFLARYNSPLTPYADVFVRSADRHDIDWRLVPAITGVESTFGKRIPYNSYNAYGWANGDYKFESWESSIEHVTKTLREKYYNKGADTIDKIARRYAPPSKTWGNNVKFFMNKIEPDANTAEL